MSDDPKHDKARGKKKDKDRGQAKEQAPPPAAGQGAAGKAAGGRAASGNATSGRAAGGKGATGSAPAKGAAAAQGAGDGAEKRRLEGGTMSFEHGIQALKDRLREFKELANSTSLDLAGEIEQVEQQLRDEIAKVYSELTPWERVNVARNPKRPVTGDYVQHMLDHFVELHGDRAFGDDPAMLTGLATMGGRRFLLVGHRKGRTVKERLECNFGCAHPEGYRKAWRKMKLAEKLGLPIVTLINTPGAYPGIGAEERGQAMAIAENIIGMFSLRVPIVVLVIGEGGSGGALGVGVGDRVLMMENSYYSVISPEGCAAILWKNGERSPEAAAALKLTSDHLVALGIVDEVVPEPLGGAHSAPEEAIATVRETLLRHLEELDGVPPDELIRSRRHKFRHIAALPGRFPVIAG
jgi:acetyl-CoA carboxylase carboxyl transferase subunit alpha